jgi:cell division protein FtsL
LLDAALRQVAQSSEQIEDVREKIAAQQEQTSNLFLDVAETGRGETS